MRHFQNLKVEIEDRIALVTVNREPVLNALNEATLTELEEVFADRLRRQDVGAVLVTGEGSKAFVAGADVKELAGIEAWDGQRKAARGQAILQKIEDFPKAVIAAINGYCLGGGLELALACHIRIAAEHAQLGLPEVTLGIIPGYGGTQRLPRLIGEGRAMEMILSGGRMSAQDAERIGLVNRVVRAEMLLSECRALAKKILGSGPLSVQYAIEAINQGLYLPLEQGLRLESALFSLCCATEDMKEGTRAFVEKRKPEFRGK